MDDKHAKQNDPSCPWEDYYTRYGVGHDSNPLILITQPQLLPPDTPPRSITVPSSAPATTTPSPPTNNSTARAKRTGQQLNPNNNTKKSKKDNEDEAAEEEEIFDEARVVTCPACNCSFVLFQNGQTAAPEKAV